LIGARSFHDEHCDRVRFPFRPTRDNTNEWTTRPHDVPRHDAVRQDWRFFKLADLVERHLLSRPQISGDIDDAPFLVSFSRNRAVVAFHQLPRNLGRAVASSDRMITEYSCSLHFKPGPSAREALKRQRAQLEGPASQTAQG